MGDIDDRWMRDTRDPDTGKPILGPDGKPVRERSDRWGQGKRYLARWRDDHGKQRGKSYDTLRDARAWLAQVSVDLARGSYVDPKAGRITLDDWAPIWLSHQVTDLSSQHQAELRVRVHILPTLGHHQLITITPTVVKAWIAGLRASGLADNYARALLSTLSSILQAAVDDGRLTKNPCTASTVRPPARQSRKVVPWPHTQVEAVREALTSRYREMGTVAAGLGLRQGEVFGLPVDDVDWLRREVHVRVQVKLLHGKLYFALPKRGKERTVPLPGEVGLRLAGHVKRHPPVAVPLPWGSPTGKPRTYRLLFTTPDGNAVHRQTFVKHNWWPALKAAKVPQLRENGMHALRHYFASVLLDGGASIRDLAEWLGHNDPGFTLRVYSHLMPSSSDRMRSVIDAVFAEAPDEPGEQPDAGLM